MTKHFLSQLKIYFSSKIAISYPQASMKDFQAPGTLRREHPAFQNMKFLHWFLFFYIFALLDSDPDPADKKLCGSMRIRIHDSATLIKTLKMVDFHLKDGVYGYMLNKPTFAPPPPLR
jgi:hypothetical protein